MKSSYTRTPRTLDEATFHSSGQALWGFQAESGRHWADWALLVAAAGLVGAIAWGLL